LYTVYNGCQAISPAKLLFIQANYLPYQDIIDMIKIHGSRIGEALGCSPLLLQIRLAVPRASHPKPLTQQKLIDQEHALVN
jgi:hypothetical protein